LILTASKTRPKKKMVPKAPLSLKSQNPLLPPTLLSNPSTRLNPYPLPKKKPRARN
jgi:hypothetical protein